MKEALKEAKIAYSLQEIPVGAIIVCNSRIIARAHNRKEELQDPTAHAEILALQKATRYLGTWHLENATLYVTLEPCIMCVGSLILSRLRKVYFGAYDPKSGSVVSVNQILDHKKYNHVVEYEGGILEDACSSILKDFFKTLRRKENT